MPKFDIDLDTLEKLATIMEEKGLTELVFEEDESKLKLQRGPLGGGVFAAPTLPSALPAPLPGAPLPGTPTGAMSSSAPAASAAPSSGDHPGAVPSPMVGTTYLAPQPGSANFVSVGSSVKEGDTLLIIEAMKVMNQIPAPKSGTVTAILVEDGQPVEFGEALVVIE